MQLPLSLNIERARMIRYFLSFYIGSHSQQTILSRIEPHTARWFLTSVLTMLQCAGRDVPSRFNVDQLSHGPLDRRAWLGGQGMCSGGAGQSSLPRVLLLACRLHQRCVLRKTSPAGAERGFEQLHLGLMELSVCLFTNQCTAASAPVG